MKKFIINEDWELEEIESTESIFAIVYSQSATEKYVLSCSTNDIELFELFNSFTDELEEKNVSEKVEVSLIELPNTSQVRALLDIARYNGSNISENNTEATMSLLLNPELNELEYWHGEDLTEAKKKKKKRKKRKTPRVTYTTGWPWYNDHMFNHHMGSCDCDKDKDKVGEDAADDANDAIGGGESVGDASSGGDFGGDFGGSDSAGGEGGGMGESLTEDKDLLFPDSLTKLIDKYDIEIEWRGYGKTKDQYKYFVKLPVPDKRRLKVWNDVCDLNPVDTSLIKSGISFILDSQSILENSIKEYKNNETLNEAMTPLQKMQALENGTRGFNAAAASDQKLWDNLRICAANNLLKAYKIMQDELVKRGLLKFNQTKQSITTINESDFHPADFLFIKDNKTNINIILENINSANNSLKQAIITLLFALTANYNDVAKAIKEWILNNILKEDFKKILTAIKAESKILNKVFNICNEYIK